LNDLQVKVSLWLKECRCVFLQSPCQLHDTPWLHALPCRSRLMDASGSTTFKRRGLLPIMQLL